MTSPEGFGTKIRELRKALNMSQRELAQAVEERLEDKKGFDFTYLSKIETRGWVPSTPVVKALANALKVKDKDFDDLFTLAGKTSDAMETVMKTDGAKQFFRSALRNDLTEEDWKKLLANLNKTKGQ